MSIEVRHITKTFGRFKALDDVSLEVPDGELVALLGPSGSGKTTLLRIIAGLDQPDPRPESEILFHQENVARRGAGQRHVGFVFQHYALFRHMTVFENIAFGMRVRPRRQRPSKAEIQSRVRELLRLIQLENLENRYPNQLSGGQRQRVALARALAIEPRVLLLDEPFGALDAKVRQELRRWLRRLHDEIHVTSIFVTHDQEEALEVADLVVVTNEGRIEQVGTPEEVFHRPATEFVVKFLGNINLFHGRVAAGAVTFGPLVLGQAQKPVPDGQEARAFVRPYDLEIHRKNGDRPMLDARVVRVLSAGPVVKVELKAETGEPLFVEVPHDRFKELNLKRDERVFVSVRDARVFVEDYAI
ncbi:MAG: sulfate ABC transporter ATP-binding protein [Candidatus Hydrogenedentes bacterium]|nr:sulfate ABC transporter ATP-binding protein [Candidatus Hydrogenedentota bacterium]